MHHTLRTLMPKTLATAGIAGALAFTGLTIGTAPAQASVTVQAATTTPTPADADPVEQDGNDDSGKWGLAGLTGLVGLFGYKKYRDHRTSTHTGDRAAGSTRP